MKKNILLTVFTVLSLGVGVAVFAYANTAINTKMSCCPKGADSCPMKMKDTEKASMSHDSCPMKMKNASSTSTSTSTASCENCDCCTGDSCPMKHNKDAAAKTSADTGGTATTCDCPCCHHDTEKKDSDTAV